MSLNNNNTTVWEICNLKSTSCNTTTPHHDNNNNNNNPLSFPLPHRLVSTQTYSQWKKNYNNLSTHFFKHFGMLAFTHKIIQYFK